MREYQMEKEISGERTRRAKRTRRADQLLCGRPGGRGDSRIDAGAQAGVGRLWNCALERSDSFEDAAMQFLPSRSELTSLLASIARSSLALITPSSVVIYPENKINSDKYR